MQQHKSLHMVYKLNGFLVDPLANSYIVYHFPRFPSLLPSSTSKHKLGMIQVSTLIVKPTWLKQKNLFENTNGGGFRQQNRAVSCCSTDTKRIQIRCSDKKPHTLKKCQDRKFLRENSNCFRGCKSSVHPARECQSNIKCTERNSDKHESALHPGQAPWFINLLQEHGGKPEPIQTLDITIQFTQICGVRLSLLRSARPRSILKQNGTKPQNPVLSQLSSLQLSLISLTC